MMLILSSLSSTSIASLSTIKKTLSSTSLTSSTSSIGAIIANAKTSYEVLESSSLLILTGEEKQQHHYQHQYQYKQQQHSINALSRIVKFTIGNNQYQYKQRNTINSDLRLYRLINASIQYSINNTNWLIADFEQSCNALINIITIITSNTNNDNHQNSIINDIIQLIHLQLIFIGRMNKDINPIYTDKLYWSISRLRHTSNYSNDSSEKINNYYETIKRLRESLLQLPFDVIQQCCTNVTTYNDLRNEVQFQSEELKTRTGAKVTERRMTCWMAEKSIGGLAYSGKIMKPVPFCNSVTAVRDAIESKTGIYYDCCLINLYPDGDCACKFHSDPDMGTMWSRDTVVVSFGEVRRFHFRKIDDSSDSEQHHFTYRLFEGDVVSMFGSCQDDFQHAVMKGENENNDEGRISIVFKKSIPGPNGRRGHGISDKTNAKPNVISAKPRSSTPQQQSPQKKVMMTKKRK